jgi:hypothetical protein
MLNLLTLCVPEEVNTTVDMYFNALNAFLDVLSTCTLNGKNWKGNN